MSRHVVIGTAGHVDHGKSRLVEALCGIHPDRLAEEKKRGITIDLGFAAIDLPGYGRAGLVDVPGHEKFVRTMVAGAAGMDVVLLVIAIDEGVMPQTREHLDVCRLMGIERGVVALTKIDLLPNLGSDWEDLVRADIEEALSETFLENAPIISVSADPAVGLTELREALAAAAKESLGRDQSGPLFMPIDRAFSMKGFGTVVTGTMLSGSLKTADMISVAPEGLEDPTRVRGIQVHGQEVEVAGAGQRTAINLAAIAKTEIERGAVLVSPGAHTSGRILDAELKVLDSHDRNIKQRAGVQLHVGTAHSEATLVLLEGKHVSPGSTTFVQLHLDQPLAALPGQPFILRGSRIQAGRGRTIAGGRILALATRRRRPGRTNALSGLAELASGEPIRQVEAIAKERGALTTPESDLPYLTGLPRPPLRKAIELLTSKRILIVADSDRRLLIHKDAIADMEKKAIELIDNHFASQPLSGGISKEELRSSLPGPPPARLFNSLLSTVASTEDYIVDVDRVKLKQEDLPETENETVELIRCTILNSALAPPRLEQLATSISKPLQHTKKLLMLLVDQGSIVKVKDDLFFHSTAIQKLEQQLCNWLDEHGEISTQDFKELTGVTRRHAIPLSEYFDERQITLRVGNKRIRRKKKHQTGSKA